MRIDLKRDKAQRVEVRRLRDGHIVGRLDRRAGHVTAGADTEVRQTGGDPLADRLQQAVPIQLREEAKRVAAAYEEGRRLTHCPHRVGVAVDAVEKVAGVDALFRQSADVAVVIGEGVGDEQHPGDGAEEAPHFRREEGYPLRGTKTAATE